MLASSGNGSALSWIGRSRTANVSQNFAGDAIRGALPAMPAVKEHHRTLHYAEIGSAIEAIENCRASKSVKLLWAVPRPNRGPKRRGPAGHVERN